MSLCTDGRVNCNCFNSFHRERPREHKRLHCEMLQHRLRQVPICHQFDNTEQYIILPSLLSTLAYEPKRSATMMCFYDTQTRSLSRNSRSRLVCHCATQLSLKDVESTKHNCGPWWSSQNYGTCAHRINHHPSLDSVLLHHWSSKVSEVRARIVQIVYETLTFRIRHFMARPCRADSQRHVFNTVEFLHNDCSLNITPVTLYERSSCGC